MGDLCGAFGEREEAAVGQHVEHPAHLVVALGVELLERDAPAHRAARGVLAGQPQQDPARHGLLMGVELSVRRLGQPPDRAEDAARPLVRRERSVRPSRSCQSSSSALDSSGRAPGAPSTSASRRSDELGLDAQPGALRRQLDRAAQLLVLHRADEDVVGAQQRAELRVGRAVAVEVGAHGEHDGGRARTVVAGSGERLDELRPLGRVRGRG